MKITIGSTNPVKIKATKDALEVIRLQSNRFIDSKENFEFLSTKIIIPELNNTPNTIEEMINGAKIRSKKALLRNDSDLGVGIEGGIFTVQTDIFLTAFAVITDRNGNSGIGSAPGIKVPSDWEISTDKSFELGSYVDSITGNSNVKQKNGAMGILTDDIITRGESLKLAVICAYYSLIRESSQQKI